MRKERKRICVPNKLTIKEILKLEGMLQNTFSRKTEKVFAQK